ncbi:hypothetical protein [Ramlibacter alkalitolerans]|uniref:Uncharacterized protein n=1 Tax=Ramlibacter alkalitolerans TaxID=2039631 RepID=A0ABS1JJK8_9BURK|nr:hypothetical protein [Ramlibacter alkalitolerans]MBL0424296.1 hypothetical protein [Ramlibacter alkalitolerans]
MAHLDDRAHAPAPRRQQPFTLYAAGGRVYARNLDQKVIDLGELRQDGSAWRYRLDGNQQSGQGFSTAEEALRDIGGHLRFLWLDGQFTAVADARDGDTLNLDGVPEVEILLDELKPGEPMVDASV